MIKTRARMIANVRSASLNRIKKERDVFSFHWLHVDRIGLQRFNIYIHIDIPGTIPWGTIWYLTVKYLVPLIPGTYISDILESTLF